jgi:hypothetical protein
MSCETFRTDIKTRLAPSLRRGDPVILYNLAGHKSAKAEAISASALRPPCSAMPIP